MITMSSAKPVVAMRRPLLRVAIIAALCAAFASLSGCSAIRLAYGQADSLVFRWLDRYADFDGPQTLRVRSALDDWFAWHRRTELPGYADLLSRVEAEVMADTTPARVCALWAEVRQRIDRAVEQALPPIVEIAATLKPVQFASIDERYAKSNAEYRDEFMHADPVKRKRETVKRIAGRAEWLYGDIPRAQRERIAASLGEAPLDPELAYQERRRRQQDALQTLRRVADGTWSEAIARAEVRAWVQRIERSPREAYRAQSERAIQHNCRVAADLHNGTSEAQRQVASKKLRGWASELRMLAAEAGG
jgi:hypothetical protein